jgi:uncharacterized alkaline shock family protein YloU
MEVYALVGQSGTGKSYKAIMVARDKNTEYIIDDGLLIGGTRVIAGKSAKKEDTKLAAVRRALFKDKEHRNIIKMTINDLKPKRILVLGTSLKMIEQIVEALELPYPCEIININDISTDNEINKAVKSRRKEGKHVIPVPSVEVKKDFSGYFIDSLKIFRKREKVTDIAEKTIIRPTFSYLGRYEVSKNALIQVVEISALNVKGVDKVRKVKIDSNAEGVIVNVELVLTLIKRLDFILTDVQKEVTEGLEYSTGLNVLKVNVWAVGLSLTDKSIYVKE